MNIFCDLDGVLVDFVGGALAIHRKTIPPHAVRWNFPQQVGIPEADFWRPLGREFWAGLGWTVEGPSLFDYLWDNHKADLAFLSAPCNTDGCCDGKLDWVRRETPEMAKRLVLASCKDVFAHGDALLIDDYDGNVVLFRAAGGNALLVPRPWNARRDDCDEYGRFDVVRFIGEIEETLT